MIDRVAVAKVTTEMIALVDRLLAGEVTRAEVKTWAGRVSPYERPAFRGNASADALHTCLYNLDVTLADGPLVRDLDLRAHLEAVRAGKVVFEETPSDASEHPIAELAARVGAVVTRFAIEGLGWFCEARFASRATGRPFAVMASLDGAPCSLHLADRPWTEPERADAIADLRATLGLDG